MKVCRITVRRGKTTKRFVLTTLPFSKVGDIITFKGEGAEWTVIKAVVEKDAIPITFPRARAGADAEEQTSD